jgi:hypothetical protein
MLKLIPNIQSFFISASDSVRPTFGSLVTPLNSLFKASRTAAERKHEKRLKNTMTLNRMARDLESSQPSLAAELRYFASR